MGKINLSKIVNGVIMTMKKYSPEILTGLGITGLASTTVLAVRATPKALILIEEEKRNRNDKNNELYDIPMKKIDYVKTAWKCYIPATAIGAMSVACLIGASSMNLKRNTALATAYTLSESALKEYQEKVIETIGETKEQVVRDAMAKDRLEQNPITNREVIITDKGDTLCYDYLSGRYFNSDIDKIRRAENDLNARMLDEMYISLNEFYSELGLDEIGMGYELGWNINKERIRLGFSSQLTPDEKPCIVLDYMVAPYYNYK